MKRILAIVTLALGLSPNLVGATEASKSQPTVKSGEAPTHIQPAQVDAKKMVPSLMVMNAKGYTYDNGKLTLKDASPTTILFADRPERLTGAVPTADFIADWSEGKDSFEKVPPNAALTSFSDKGAQTVVVELKNPVRHGDDVTYDVRALRGQPQAKGGESSLFIDIIGMPLTPMSYAGVARRTARRAVFFR